MRDCSTPQTSAPRRIRCGGGGAPDPHPTDQDLAVGAPDLGPPLICGWPDVGTPMGVGDPGLGLGSFIWGAAWVRICRRPEAGKLARV